MNKNEAMIERLKGKEIAKCKCGSYMVELDEGDAWIEFECKSCDYNTIRTSSPIPFSTSSQKKWDEDNEVRYPRVGTETFIKENEHYKDTSFHN